MSMLPTRTRTSTSTSSTRPVAPRDPSHGVTQTTTTSNQGVGHLLRTRQDETQPFTIAVQPPRGGSPLGQFAKAMGLKGAEAAAFKADAAAFISALTKVAKQELALGDKPDVTATRTDQLKAVLASGATGYATSFLIAKVAGILVGFGHPMASAAMLVPAGLLHALFTEPYAGAKAVNYGIHSTPDGTAVGNYVTASAMWVAAKVSGDRGEAKVWHGRMDKLVLDAMNRADKDGLMLQSKSHPIMSAMARSFLTDHLPFESFALTYVVSGSMVPVLRPLLSGPALGQKVAAAATDCAITISCGLLAGIGTVAAQNLMRAQIQKSPAKVGAHHKAVLAWQKQVCTASGPLLEAKLVKLQSMHRALTRADHPVNGRLWTEGAEKSMLQDLRQSIKTVKHAIAKNEKVKKGLRSALGRDHMGAMRHIAAYSGETGKNAVPWLDGPAARIRVAGKAISNMLALAPAAVYLGYLALELGAYMAYIHPAASPPETAFNQTLGFNSTMGANSALPSDSDAATQLAQRVVGEFAAYGQVLVTCWLMRPVLAPMTEMLAGLALGISHRATGDVAPDAAAAAPARVVVAPGGNALHHDEDGNALDADGEIDSGEYFSAESDDDSDDYADSSAQDSDAGVVLNGDRVQAPMQGSQMASEKARADDSFSVPVRPGLAGQSPGKRIDTAPSDDSYQSSEDDDADVALESPTKFPASVATQTRETRTLLVEFDTLSRSLGEALPARLVFDSSSSSRSGGSSSDPDGSSS